MARKTKSKARLDRFYRIAKEQGFRSRAAFKLIQLNRRYAFLEHATVLVDLCAAPGGWLQVAAQSMPAASLIVGVDLDPIRPVAGALTFQADIAGEECGQRLRRELKHLKADVVLHDGAPNVGSDWSKDAYAQSELCLAALRLATRLLRAGGTFVTKVFRSTDYLSLRRALGHLFAAVETNKPEASRATSAEIFLVCSGFVGQERVQAEWLDPLQVFARTDRDVFDGAQRVDSLNKVFARGKHRAIPDGAPATMFRRLPLEEFLGAANPFAAFDEFNCIAADEAELRALEAVAPPPADLAEMLADLKLLGKPQLRALLKWRLKIRNARGRLRLAAEKAAQPAAPAAPTPSPAPIAPIAAVAPETLAESAPLLLRELHGDAQRRAEKGLLRRAKRNLDRGAEPGAAATDDELGAFRFTRFAKSVAQARFTDLEALNAATVDGNRRALDGRSRPEALADVEDNIEFLYEQRQQREKQHAKAKAAQPPTRRERLEALAPAEVGRLRAQSPWFEREIFKGLEGGEAVVSAPPPAAASDSPSSSAAEEEEEEYAPADLERAVGARPIDEEEAAELRAISRKMLRKKSRREILDQSYGRHNYPEDPATLPRWFADDQRRAVGKIPQVTKEDIQRERERLHLLSRRLPMKVIEAKYRKKKRLLSRLDRAKSAAQEVIDSDTLTPLLKGRELNKLYGKALSAGKAPRKKVIVSRRFSASAPRAKKGRKYKTVDRRLKKDLRAQKKIGKKSRK